MVAIENISIKQIWKLLEEIPDPELPALSIVDLGIVREVKINYDTIEIIVTPTYSGCPAMDIIRMNIRLSLMEQGCPMIKITTILSPAWTTAWMNGKAKQKLNEYGIAPPIDQNVEEKCIAIRCPLCNSANTKMISQFGSAACKALYQCNDCREPFDYFKCH